MKRQANSGHLLEGSKRGGTLKRGVKVTPKVTEHGNADRHSQLVIFGFSPQSKDWESTLGSSVLKYLDSFKTITTTATTTCPWHQTIMVTSRVVLVRVEEPMAMELVIRVRPIRLHSKANSFLFCTLFQKVLSTIWLVCSTSLHVEKVAAITSSYHIDVSW